MKKIIYQVDAFTDEPFKGNPAGVMLCDALMAPELMQNIAMEMNLSETAFIAPDGDDFQIRYFTPVKEVPLCGHATLASAHILYESGVKKPDDTLFLKAKGAELTINRNNDWIVINFPKYPLKKIDTPAAFKEIVGFEPIETYLSSYDWIVAVAGSETDIERAKPDLWSEKLNKVEMDSLQISQRIGKLKVRRAENDRMEISGKAIAVFEANWKI
ncbi:MAG: PhzF family phenazine biosynthesis isomerase [Candidatus Azobacteroides sp.]|nr:PhzF family phenazine biosynthesis isomerase [Candidatus Azobacteroides sp.]